MKKLLLLSVMGLALTACGEKATSPNNTQQQSTMTSNAVEMSDNEISQKVQQALMSDQSSSAFAKDLKVVTVGGIVTLRGSVSSENEKSNAEKIAKGVPGVKNVITMIDVEKK